MKKPARILSLSVALAVISACSSVTVISYQSDFEAPKKYTEYLSYYLPKTYLKIRVPVEQIAFSEGLFHQLKDPELKAEIEKEFYMNFGWSPPTKPSITYTLGNNIQFIPMTVPDENKHFTIAFKDARVFTQSLNIKLNRDGIVSSGEFAQENRTFEFVSKGLELGASLASKFLALGLADSALKDPKIMTDPKKPEEYLRIQMLAKELHDIANSKAQMLTQVVPDVSKEAIEYRVESIDKRIAEIQREIFGVEKKIVQWMSFLYEPKFLNDTLLVIDSMDGSFVPKLDRKLLESYDEGKRDSMKALTIKAIRESTPLPVSSATEKKLKLKPSDSTGFLRYNLPAKYSIQLFWEGEPLKSFSSSEDTEGTDRYYMFFPQYGKIGVLPGNFKDASIIYYEDIGAIKEVKFARTATATAEALQQAYDAADSMVSAYETYQKEKQAEETEGEEEETEETEETIFRLFIEQGELQ